jgi:hypothetical protein
MSLLVFQKPYRLQAKEQSFCQIRRTISCNLNSLQEEEHSSFLSNSLSFAVVVPYVTTTPLKKWMETSILLKGTASAG